MPYSFVALKCFGRPRGEVDVRFRRFIHLKNESRSRALKAKRCERDLLRGGGLFLPAR